MYYRYREQAHSHNGSVFGRHENGDPKVAFLFSLR
jgi:hypothetical protein